MFYVLRLSLLISGVGVLLWVDWRIALGVALITAEIVWERTETDERIIKALRNHHHE